MSKISKKRQPRHAAEFKELALSKAMNRGDRTIESVAEELSMSIGTLKGWLKTRSTAMPGAVDEPLPSQGSAAPWSPAQRLQALMQSYALEGEALNAWCREHGVFAHQLAQWRHDFGSAPLESRESKAELCQLQGEHERLRRELNRKEKPLPCWCFKKFQALWEDEAK